MTILPTLSTIDTNPNVFLKKAQDSGSFSKQTQIGIDDQVRTFGGIPLITGIKSMYKNSAIVREPDSTDTPTSNLARKRSRSGKYLKNNVRRQTARKVRLLSRYGRVTKGYAARA